MLEKTPYQVARRDLSVKSIKTIRVRIIIVRRFNFTISPYQFHNFGVDQQLTLFSELGYNLVECYKV
jgi:hypothetical protein